MREKHAEDIEKMKSVEEERARQQELIEKLQREVYEQQQNSLQLSNQMLSTNAATKEQELVMEHERFHTSQQAVMEGLEQEAREHRSKSESLEREVALLRAEVSKKGEGSVQVVKDLEGLQRLQQEAQKHKGYAEELEQRLQAAASTVAARQIASLRGISELRAQFNEQLHFLEEKSKAEVALKDKQIEQLKAEMHFKMLTSEMEKAHMIEEKLRKRGLIGLGALTGQKARSRANGH